MGAVMKIVLLGRHEILYSTFANLMQNSSHTVVAMITAPAPVEYQKNEQDFERLAKQHNIPFLLVKSLNTEAYNFLERFDADICVSVNWVSVIGEMFISKFPKGVLNAHFADLPRYRGNAATNWALLRGETKIPLSVHFMTPGELDSGDIVAQKEMQITDETTIRDIHDFAQTHAPSLFLLAIDRIQNQQGPFLSQAVRASEAFRAYPRIPLDSKIDWKQSARSIHALIRASTKPYLGAYCYYRDQQGHFKKLHIWKSRIVAESTSDIGICGHIIKNDPISGESWIYTGQGILALQICSDDEGSEFRPGETWKSIRLRLGIDAEEELYKLLRKGRTDD